MMRRGIRTAALVLAALAPVACATEGTLGTEAPDLFDEPAASFAASVEYAPDASFGAAAASPATAAASSGAAAAATADSIGAVPQGAVHPAASAQDLASLQAQAEDAYRARRFDAAVSQYERLVALQPSNAHVWLRLGNVHHHRRDWFKALAAYRRAAARTIGGVETEPSLRAKAIYNVALIDLELARQSLRSLERLGEAGLEAGDPAPLAREIERTQRRLDNFSTNGTAARPAPVRMADPKGAQRTTPSPKGEELPKVDYIRGEPRP